MYLDPLGSTTTHAGLATRENAIITDSDKQEKGNKNEEEIFLSLSLNFFNRKDSHFSMFNQYIAYI